MSGICKISDATREVGKYLGNFFGYLDLGEVGYKNEEIYPNMCVFFVRKKYATFTIERIVALRSVNKIFPESYDFAAM
jgi:hypothetical protein